MFDPGWLPASEGGFGREIGYVDVPAGGGTEGLAELARAAAPTPGMSPYEILAQTIELAATFGDLPGEEGNLTVNEVNGWINAIRNDGDPWGMIEEIRANILQYRVTPARVAETYGITVEEAEMLTGPGGDIKAFLDSDKTEIVNRDTGAVTTIGSGPTDGGPTSTELRSATDIVRNILETYGLGELLNDPDLDLINLWVTTGDAAAVWARVRQSDPYKDRFPGMAALSEAGRAVSEATYIELERGYIEIMNSAGIDSGFYDEPSKLLRTKISERLGRRFRRVSLLPQRTGQFAGADVFAGFRKGHRPTVTVTSHPVEVRVV